MDEFKATVQYNDLRGGVAADKADETNALKYLKNNNLIGDNEYILGISMWAGENHGKHTDPVYVTFLVSDLKGYESVQDMINASSDVIELREIKVDMNILDFFSLFKRLMLTLSTDGIMEGKTYTRV